MSQHTCLPRLDDTAARIVVQGLAIQNAGGRRREAGDGIRERRYATSDTCSPTPAAQIVTDAISDARRPIPNPTPSPAARYPDSSGHDPGFCVMTQIMKEPCLP
jgi:hypothetical protein